MAVEDFLASAPCPYPRLFAPLRYLFSVYASARAEAGEVCSGLFLFGAHVHAVSPSLGVLRLGFCPSCVLGWGGGVVGTIATVQKSGAKCGGVACNVEFRFFFWRCTARYYYCQHCGPEKESCVLGDFSDPSLGRAHRLGQFYGLRSGSMAATLSLENSSEADRKIVNPIACGRSKKTPDKGGNRALNTQSLQQKTHFPPGNPLIQPIGIMEPLTNLTRSPTSKEGC